MMNVKVAALAVVLCLLAGGKVRAADTYQVDAAHSFASFSISHLGIGLVRGAFPDIAGTIVLDEKDAAKSSIEVTIRTASVNTHVAKRDEHLRSQDFFEVEKHPTMTFTSTKVVRKRKGYAVTGEFSLHGVTRQITVEAKRLGSGKDPWGGYRAGFVADFTINRSDFGMKYDLAGIGDKVDISVAIEAVKQ